MIEIVSDWLYNNTRLLKINKLMLQQVEDAKIQIFDLVKPIFL